MMSLRSAVLLAATLLGGAATALAAEPAYVGTWGADAAQCKVTQDKQGAPTIFAALRYDVHETHCTFGSVKKTGATWRVTAQCLVDGSKMKDSFSLAVAGDMLTMTRGKSAQVLKRCR